MGAEGVRKGLGWVGLAFRIVTLIVSLTKIESQGHLKRSTPSRSTSRIDSHLLPLTHCLHLTLGRGVSHGRVDWGDAALPRIILSPGVDFALRSDGKTMRLCVASDAK